jgi:hypothetical protein
VKNQRVLTLTHHMGEGEERSAKTIGRGTLFFFIVGGGVVSNPFSYICIYLSI